MTWKIEKWLSEVFPGEDRLYEEYRGLSGRELAIVAAAVLDLAYLPRETRQNNAYTGVLP